jgi:hypothetical protein
MPCQLALPLERTARVRRGRRVRPRPEDERLYHAVLALRGAGHRVYRAGAFHKIDDRAVTTEQLLALGRRVTEGRKQVPHG